MKPDKAKPDFLIASGESSLVTSRLLLRIFQPGDAPEVERLLNDKEIASNTRSIDFPYPLGGGIKWIENQTQLRSSGDAYCFAICKLDSTNEERLMGAIALTVNKTDHNAELGYWMGRDFWNRGYCTEACHAIVEFGFETLGLQKLTSHHLSRNPASGRVLDKIGMTREGLCRKHVRKWGVFEDVVLYGMLAGDSRPDSAKSQESL